MTIICNLASSLGAHLTPTPAADVAMAQKAESIVTAAQTKLTIAEEALTTLTPDTAEHIKAKKKKETAESELKTAREKGAALRKKVGDVKEAAAQAQLHVVHVVSHDAAVHASSLAAAQAHGAGSSVAR